MAKATVQELVKLIGTSVMAAHAVAGDKVYDLHIFLQTYSTQSGPDYYTVHCDTSYIAYDRKDGYDAAIEALRAELPTDVFDLDYGALYSDASEAFDAEMETAVW